MLEAEVHSENNQSNYHRCNHHNNRTVCEFAPCRPRSLVYKLVLYVLKIVYYLTHDSFEIFSTGGETRTPDTWFWRPVLYQLSYTRKSEGLALAVILSLSITQRYQLPDLHLPYGHPRESRNEDLRSMLLGG